MFASKSTETEQGLKLIRNELDIKIQSLAITQSRILTGQETLSRSLYQEQEGIGGCLQAHATAEQEAGREIHPAARVRNAISEKRIDDDCKRLFLR